MKTRLVEVINLYASSTSPSQQITRLEVGMDLIADGALEEFEEDRLLEVLVGRVMARRAARC